MKTIIKSVFLVAILALVITGCQKEGDDLNVSLKSTIAFTGGIYISPWQSGDAEFECAQAGGCDGGSYKMDQGVYAGSSFNGGGVTVTGISKQEFSWSSIYPVCKIIVKAGNGAYIFDIGGAQSGSVPYPKDLNVKEKDISHITFCFGEPQKICKDAWALKNYTFYAKCFYDLNLTGFTPSRLGWTNGRLWPQLFQFNLFAGGIDCTNYGTLVGTMTINYNGTSAAVNITMISPYTLDGIHAYFGYDKLPMYSGQYTDDPALYPIRYDLDDKTSFSFTADGLSGDIYMLIHASVCGF
jgi:hypothetical protein